jgi:hypothetical protein
MKVIVVGPATSLSNRPLPQPVTQLHEIAGIARPFSVQLWNLFESAAVQLRGVTNSGAYWFNAKTNNYDWRDLQANVDGSAQMRLYDELLCCEHCPS